MPKGVEVDAPAELVLELAQLYEQRRHMAKRGLDRYYMNPARFARDCIDWGDDEFAEYQYETLEELAEYGRVSMRSLRGAGKTTTEAVAVLWHSITRDAMCFGDGPIRDWKCATTAGAWNQLERYLWPEIHKWARRLRWDRLLRDPFKMGGELMRLNLHLAYGQAFAVASANANLGEGLHADSVLVVLDESKSIPIPTWDSLEGSLNGLETEVFVLSGSTPGEPIGRFFDIQTHQRGYEDWHVIHIGLERAVAAGRVDPAWAAQRALQWGEDSALYANHVLGEFHTADESAIIPLSWIEAAIERWKDTELRIEKNPDLLGPLTSIGVDVARYGDDESAISLIYGNRVQEIRRFFHESNTSIAGRVGGIVSAAENPDILKLVVDTDGLGAGVTDILRERDINVLAFHGRYATDRKDRSGELGFVGWRDAAWWNMRDLLDPHPCACPGLDRCPLHGSTIELPPDDQLKGDLAGPRLKRINSKSKIEIEQKEDTKKRLGRSPDSGDSVIMPFFPGDRPKRRRRMVAAGRAVVPSEAELG